MPTINTLEEARKHPLSTRQRYEILYRIIRIRKQRLLPIAVSPLVLKVEATYQNRRVRFFGWRNTKRFLEFVARNEAVYWDGVSSEELPF